MSISKSFNFSFSKGSVSSVISPKKPSIPQQPQITPSVTPTATIIPLPTPVQTTGNTYNVVFYKNKSFFNSATNSNLILEEYSALNLICYKKGVNVTKTPSVDKIISFTSNTGSYKSGLDSYNTELNKIYIDDQQQDWLSTEVYQELVYNKLYISGYNRSDNFLGIVRILSGDVVSDQGTLEYSGDSTIVQNMEYFRFDINKVGLIPNGFLILKLSGTSYYESALKYLIDNKLGYKNYFELLNTFFINVSSSVLDETDIFTLRNDIQNQIFCKFCIVDYLFDSKLNYQIPYESPLHWYLHNIKSREAWELMDSISPSLTNSTPVEIALLDCGVDVGHPELSGKISQYSFNPLSLLNPDIPESQVGIDFSVLETCPFFVDNPSFFHGTGTAGLLAASNSNNDLMYSASNDKVKIQIIPLKYWWFTQSPNTCGQSVFVSIGMLTASFNKILENPNCAVIVTTMTFGQPIVGNTLGYGNSGEFLQEIITIVTTEGRNGKGIPFFASSGNDPSEGGVVYPGNYNYIYPVGASHELDSRAGFSQYGEGLFIVAPGVNIMSLSPRGNFGRNLGLPLISPKPGSKVPKNLKDLVYTNNSLQVSFGGTSSSAPIVAAVAATMIYINPSLTRTQVINILAETARKVGTDINGNPYQYVNGKNLEMGYGIVDHEEAIQGAINLIPSPSQPWNEPLTVNILNLPETAQFGEVISITFEVLLDNTISAGTEFIGVEVYAGDGVLDESVIIGEFIYNDFDESTTFTENLQIPIEPFGQSSAKYIIIRAKAFDEMFNFLSYGFDTDNSIIQISNSLSDPPLVDLEITLLGVVCLNNVIPCGQVDGHSWKVKIKNLGNVTVNRVRFNLNQDSFPYGLYNNSQNPNLPEFLWPDEWDDISTSFEYYSGLTQNSIGTTALFYDLIPGEQRIFYWKFAGWSTDSYTNSISNLPSRFKLIVGSVYAYQPYDPNTGVQIDPTIFGYFNESNVIEINNWPS